MSALAPFSFSSAHRRTLAALAPVVLSDEVLDLGLVDDVVDGMELFLRAIPTPVRVGLVAGIATFEQSARGAPSSLGRGFSSLPRAKQEAHFARWFHAPGALGQLPRGLKMFLTFSYYEHPRVKEKLGYDPERWIEKVSRERVERFGDAIAAEEARMLEPNPLTAPVRPRRAAAAAPADATPVTATRSRGKELPRAD